MSRPTIADLAKASGVSVSTVDRVLNARNPVRRATAERVLEAAEQIGFYATGVIRQRLGTDRPVLTFGFLLLQRSRSFYRKLAQAVTEAANRCSGARVKLRIDFLEDLSPQNVADRMTDLSREVNALAVVAPEHPKVTDVIEDAHTRGVPIVALISPLSAPSGAGFVGLDNWKVGRTSAWTFANICKQPGKIGIIVGSHRYRCQELNEIGFRSYFRENAPEFQLLEPMISFEERHVAAELTRDLLHREPDLAGLYISGGGITGVMDTLREAGAAGRLVTVGYELMTETRSGLLDNILTLIISHPLERLAAAAVESMVDAATENKNQPLPTVMLPFDIYTAENL